MRLSVRSKLLGTSGVLIAFVVAVGVFSLVNLGTVASQTTSLSDDVVEPLAELGIARAEFNENRALLNNHMLETTRQAKAVIDTRMTGNSRTIDEQLAAFELTIQTDGGREAFADLRASLAAYRVERDEVVRLSNTSTQAEAYAHNKEKAIPATAAVVDAFTALYDSKVALGKTLATEAGATYGSTVPLTIIAILAAAVVGFGMSFWLARRISRGVTEVQVTLGSLADKCTTWLAEGMGRFRDGDLTCEITPVTPAIERYGSDEIGRTAEYTNTIRDRIIAAIGAYNDARAGLSRTIGRVQEAADAVSRTSEQLNDAATQTGAATQQVAQTISQVAGGTAEQARAASDTNGAVGELSAVIATVGEGAAETGSAEVETGLEIGRRGSESVVEIGEAARARDAALERVFAALAQIEGAAAMVTASSDDIARVVAQTAAGATQMAAASDSVTRSIGSIAAVSEENSAAAQEVSAATQEMSAQAEEVVASAASLAEMAQQLDALVAGFRLEASGTPRTAGRAGTGTEVIQRRRAGDWSKVA